MQVLKILNDTTYGVAKMTVDDDGTRVVLYRVRARITGQINPRVYDLKTIPAAVFSLANTQRTITRSPIAGMQPVCLRNLCKNVASANSGGSMNERNRGTHTCNPEYVDDIRQLFLISGKMHRISSVWHSHWISRTNLPCCKIYLFCIL